MIKIIVRYLVTNLNSADMVTLGSALISAGRAAQAKQHAINEALSCVQAGVSKLTA